MKYLLNVMLLAALCCNVVFAQPAPKAAAASSTTLVASATITAFTDTLTCTVWSKILGTSIKASGGGKDLLIGFSAQTGLFTTSSQVAFPDSHTLVFANTGIQVRVLVDSASTAVTPPPGTLASPGSLSFDNLVRQTNLQTHTDTLLFQLILSEGSVRSFNFIKEDVGVGVHTVDVQSRFCFQNVTQTTSPSLASSELSAVIGPRTLTVEAVKLNDQ